MNWLLNKEGVVNISSKVEGIIKTIYENRIESFNFKQSLEEGYYLKLDNDSIYLTSEEVTELLNKLHIKTDNILLTVFKLDLEKEAYIKRIISAVHELGLIKANISSVNATKEDLVLAVNHLEQLTKDKELAELNVNELQKEELFNILHNKHLEYLSNFTDIILTEVNSGS